MALLQRKENKQKVRPLKDKNPVSYKLITLVLLALTLLYSCSSSRAIDTTSYISNQRSRIVKSARNEIGGSYKYSAKGPNAFDCSGLVSYVYKKENIQVSGSATHLFSEGKTIPLHKASPGDLIFYKKDGRIFHVSIISKKERDKLWVVHSTTSRGVIEEDVLSSLYWKPMIYKSVTLSSYK